MKNAANEVWEKQNSLRLEELNENLLIFDAWGGTPLSHSDIPTITGRYISSEDGRRYMVVDVREEKICVLVKDPSVVNWSNIFVLSVDEWISHRMKQIVFSDGQELLPIIKKDVDGSVTMVEYLPNYSSEECLPERVTINGVLYRAEYTKVDMSKPVIMKNSEGNNCSGAVLGISLLVLIFGAALTSIAVTSLSIGMVAVGGFYPLKLLINNGDRLYKDDI